MTRAARLLGVVGWGVPLLATSLLSACFTHRPTEPDPEPAPVAQISVPTPDASTELVPKAEPRSRKGNPPYYVVFGKRYYVLSSGMGYVERGVASWYGPGFDKVPTSSGETYDMHGMSAAHKTLPLPAYVRVTNLQNGRSVVVRVNDRGPFVGNRIIDLSYSAAVKLDMLRNGTAMVEVRSLDVAPADGAPPTTAPLFIQAGAFADPANADRLVTRLHGADYGEVFVKSDEIAGRKMYRVRIGPVRDVAEFDRVVAALDRAGVHDAHLALD